jgi:phenylacetate-coenzyme A ligase PaaK-like adenylate-forming protein
MTDLWQPDLTPLFEAEPYSLKQAEKEALLLPLFNQLHQHHRQHCQAYHNIATTGFGAAPYAALADLPYLAVRLFKHLRLQSVEDEQVFKVLQSSGTSGQAPARIALDKETSKRQSQVLVKILQSHLGKARLPMLIIDSPAVLKDKTLFSARGAGIQGLAFFGRDHTYALDENMQPDWQAINQFAEKYSGQPVLIFGFTFMVWLHFIQALQQSARRLSLSGFLLHSGGWKKLEAQKVDNATFRQQVQHRLGIERVINFYGMAEQVGSVFVECEQGHLHAPVFADVLVRNPFDLSLQKSTEPGLLQLLSVLPTSYPGYSLLTEDMGYLLGVDDCPCGSKGKYFSVTGRLPKAEVRGCSDTYTGALS